MHELSIATNLVSLATEAVESALERRPITALRVRVGALSGVVVESLEFAWDVAAEGSRCEGARLEIERVPGRISCEACSTETELSDPPRFVCSRCGQRSPDVIAGQELELISLELDDSQSPAPGATPETNHAASHP